MIEAFVERVINGQLGQRYPMSELMSPREKYESLMKLMVHGGQHLQDQELLNRLCGHIVALIPYIPSEKRFGCVSELVSLLFRSRGIQSKQVFDLFQGPLVGSLQPLECLNLANLLIDQMNQNDNKLREIAMWGLVSIIPHLHAVNQREYAYDIFYLSKDVKIRDRVLAALTALVYNLVHHDRTEMVFFFVDLLKGRAYSDTRYFTLDLLKKVVPALLEEERVLVADCVIPLIYFTDTDLVKKSIDFFAVTISLLPVKQRFQYTQIVAGLINDLSVKTEVVNVLEKAMPFLNGEGERGYFREMLTDIHQDHCDEEDERSFCFETVESLSGG